MNKVLLCFGPYENITPSGMDGTRIQFPFSMTVSSMDGVLEDHRVTSQHWLIASVAGGIIWGDDEAVLAKVLFAVAVPCVRLAWVSQGNVAEEVTLFVPYGACPVALETLVDPEGAIIELDFHTSIDVAIAPKVS